MTPVTDHRVSQAHALSAKASQTSSISSTADNLSRAAELYSEAADLFDQVRKEASDSGVSMPAVQHVVVAEH